MEDIYLYLYLYLYYIDHVYTFIHYTSEYQSHVLLQTRFPKALVSSQPNEPSDVLESTSSLLGWTCCTLFLSTVPLRGPHVASGSGNNPHEAFQCAIEPPKPGHLKYLKFKVTANPFYTIQGKGFGSELMNLTLPMTSTWLFSRTNWALLFSQRDPVSEDVMPFGIPSSIWGCSFGMFWRSDQAENIT